MTRRRLLPAAAAVLAFMAVIAFVLVARRQPAPEEPAAPPVEEAAAFSLVSPAFADGDRIPRKYTCEGEDLSPPLRWTGAPDGTVTFVLIVEDPDAPLGTFTHWVLFDLPAGVEGLPEGLPKAETLEGGGVQGVNDFGGIGYGGPCPPQGETHRYRFRLYALDAKLGLEAWAAKREVLGAMKGHVLAEAEIVGLFSR